MWILVTVAALEKAAAKELATAVELAIAVELATAVVMAATLEVATAVGLVTAVEVATVEVPCTLICTVLLHPNHKTILFCSIFNLEAWLF